jgi:hypothetical protein
MTYNEEEVKELFEVVFKLSAKDVNDKLIKVRNRPEIAKRRWFWELLQNAKDAVKQDEKVSVRLIVGSDNGQVFVDFQHNGNPFRYQDAKNLVFPYSDKGEEDNSDKSGRFGTGFLATHILSKKIKVKGVYIKDEQALNFNFTLDRSGADKTEIAKSIDETWQEFRAKRTEIENYIYSSKKFETSFKYELDTDSLHLATQSILDFDVSLPFALAFIPKIKSVEILNQIANATITYHKIDQKTKQLTENIKQIEIEKKTSENGQDKTEIINLIICSDGVVDVAIEIYELNGKTFIRKFIEDQPLLFCPFPLIGANDFKFPLAINSISFLPKEERDGIWLANTIEGKTNQELLEQVVPLFQSITNYASIQKWQGTYLLFKSLKDSLLIADFNLTWFKDKIQTPIKNFIKQVQLVDVDNGERLPISFNDKTIYFPSEIKEEVHLQLWDFMNALFPNRIPQKLQSTNWYSVIWDDCPKFNISSFTKLISAYKTVESLQVALSKTKDDTLSWLNNFVAFVNKQDASLLNIIDSQILPNQFGVFKKKDELFLDDETIDQELKEILADVSKLTNKVTDWRTDMLDKKVFLELPSTRTKTLSLFGTTIAETVKELLKEENPSNELRNVFSRLLNWLNDNHYKAREHFKGLRTETLLYKTANESKIRHITDLLQKDRDGKISVEDLSNIDASKIALLQDPDLELKILLGEQVLADIQKEKEEFKFKKATGDIFETLFHQLINSVNRLTIQKVEGEEDFIITNPATNKHFYIELKSIRTTENQINMTHKQAKKANAYPDNYFLCIIPNSGETIDQSYFLSNSKFDSKIGIKLSNKIKAALAFEAPEFGISVEFEDALLSSYSKYRYKFAIQRNLWGQDNFEVFKENLFS